MNMNMNKIQEITKDFTIANYKDVIENATGEQIEFANSITEKLILDKDTNKINVVPASCGFGKSVLIKSYLKALIDSETFGFIGNTKAKYKGEGVVIVTDLLLRFDDYTTDEALKDYCYLITHDTDKNEESYQDQIIQQNNYPFLLMTTQKYFRMSEQERKIIFKYKHNKRKTVIFDEKPEFFKATEIDKEFVNSIDNDIDRITETDDKNFLDNEIKHLRDYLESEKSILSSKSEKDVITYWKGTRNNISTDDKRFASLVEKHLSVDSQIKIDILSHILRDGAVFVNKKGLNTDNRRMFFHIKDNKDYFYLGQNKAKFWIFDATASVDVEYTKEYIDILEIKHTKNYNVKVRNIHSSTRREKVYEKSTMQMINKYIENNYKDDALVTIYKNALKSIKNYKYKDYYGGMKGVNDYRDCLSIVHIGLNRFSDITYLQKYLHLYPEKMEELKSDIEGSEAILNNLLDMEYGNFVDDDMYEIMYSELLVDVEQNIFRTKLRDYANTDVVNVDLLYNSNTYKQLNILLAGRLGIDKVEVHEPVEMLESKIENRKNKEESIAQKVVRWFKENEGTGEFKIKDILKKCEVSPDQFKYAKRDNESLKKLMESKKGSKRGYYVA